MMKFHFRERGNPEIEEGPKTSRERLLENLEKTKREKIKERKNG